MTRCTECKAFLSEYQAATELYAAMTERLKKTKRDNLAPDPESAFQKLRDEVRQARLDCQRYREALRIHREGHGS